MELGDLDRKKNIAVVGGSRLDVEVEIFNGRQVAIDTFGIEDDGSNSKFTYLDLNSESEIVGQYDLVLCSQVLEHLWDIKRGLSSLLSLAKPEGLIWISCPASNFPHAAPDYYSAGLTVELIERQISSATGLVISKGYFGSKRNYFVTHALRLWMSERELRRPILNYHFQPGTLQGVIRKYFKEFPYRLFASLISNELRTDLIFATETWVLVKKIYSGKN